MDTLEYLNNIISSSAPKIKESVFKKIYLPYLFYRDPYVFNIRWITEVAYSPHARVYITDDKNTDKILFSVPPLRADLLESNDPNLLHSLNLIKAEMSINGVRGSRILEERLPMLIGVKPVDLKTFEGEWKKILDRYGYTDKYLAKSEEEITNVELFGDLDEWE